MIITIESWKKYNPRPDVERPSWFRLEGDLMLKPDNLGKFGPAEILAIIYLCSCALQNRSGTFTVVRPHAELFSRLKWKEFEAAIGILVQERVVTVAVTPLLRYETERDETRIQQPPVPEAQQPLILEPTPKPEEAGEEESQEPLPTVALLWNQFAAEELPRVTRCGAKRRKKFAKALKEEPMHSFWTKLIERVNDSPFLTGKVKPTKPGGKPFLCDCDWILDSENQDKILEGKYDAKDGSGPGGVKLSPWAQQKLEEEARRGSDV